MKELTKHTFGETTEYFKHRLAYALEQEEKPMKIKRKAYVSIIVIAVLFIAVACTALAMVFGSFEQVLEREITKGYFDTWTAEERLALVQEMIEGGLIQPDERTEALLRGEMDEEACRKLATELVTEAIGAREDTVTYLSIMESIKGPFETWTTEQKAEYSELQKQYGRESSEAEFYMRLREGDVSEDAAVRIAKEGIEKAFRLQPGTLNTYKVYTEYYRMKQGSQEPRWLVEFSDPPTQPGTAGHRMYTAIVSSTGELIDDHERSILSPENQVAWEAEYEKLMARKDAEGDKRPIFMWTLEEQAIVFPSSHGFPGPDDVPLEKAVETAKDRLLRDGVYGEADLSQLEVYSSFMIRWTDNVKVPFWSITFVRENPDSERSYTDEMLAFVDAKTGEVVWYRGMKD